MMQVAPMRGFDPAIHQEPHVYRMLEASQLPAMPAMPAVMPPLLGSLPHPRAEGGKPAAQRSQLSINPPASVPDCPAGTHHSAQIPRIASRPWLACRRCSTTARGSRR